MMYCRWSLLHLPITLFKILGTNFGYANSLENNNASPLHQKRRLYYVLNQKFKKKIAFKIKKNLLLNQIFLN